MSSILDALNKLEAEKAAAAERIDEVIDDRIAAQQLVGRRPPVQKVSIPLSRGALVLGIGAAAVLLAGVSAIVSVTVARLGTAPPSINTSPPSRPVAVAAATEGPEEAARAQVSPVPPAPAAAPETFVSGRSADGENAVPDPVSAPRNAKPASAEVPFSRPEPDFVSVQEDVPPKPPERALARQAAAPEAAQQPVTAQPVEPPAIFPVQLQRPDPVVPPAKKSKPSGETSDALPQEPLHLAAATTRGEAADSQQSPARTPERPIRKSQTPKKSEPPASKPLDISELPVLTETNKVRYGLTGLRVNMVRPADKKTRPLGSAIINLKPVYVGEFIAGTKAKLIGVDSRGIAIEISGTGKQYYMR